MGVGKKYVAAGFSYVCQAYWAFLSSEVQQMTCANERIQKQSLVCASVT